MLDGIEVAAHAAGAGEAIIGVHQGDPVGRAVRAAMAQRPPTPLPMPIYGQLHPVPDRPFQLAPCLAVLWVLAGIAYLIMLG